MAQAKRKLAAILSADVFGYARLMGDDEAVTVETLTKYRRVFRDHIARHDGRLVDAPGDNLLAEFASPVEALGAAVDIQHELARHNRQLAEHRQMHFRIGLNLGDVIAKEDGTLYGDGVNIAARLEGMAEPGGICLSETVFLQTEGKVEAAFEDIGAHEVKNIAKPVLAYRVIAEGAAHRSRTGRPFAWAAAAALVFVIAGVAVWQTSKPPPPPPEVAAEPEDPLLALPDKPSIAVLPFANLSDDPEQEYFADGLTDDLITDLSKIQDLFVIARNSSFTYKGKPTKVQDVAADLGIQFVLEGSVRRTGDTVRINAQLIDALTGHHLWAERYEGAFADIFELQDQVLDQIIANLAIVLTDVEAPIVGEAETNVVEAYDTFLQGWEYYRRRTSDDNLKAISLFGKAIELDPSYSRAYAGLAASYWDRVTLNWELTHGFEWDRAFDKTIANLDKARTITPTSETYRLSAEMLATWGRHDKAEAEINRAIALDPNSADSYLSKARLLNAIGRAEEAERSVRTAMRLDPHYRPSNLRLLALTRFHQGQYADAAELLERVISQDSETARDSVTLAAAYGHLGRRAEADAARTSYDKAMAEVRYTPMNVQEMGIWWYSDMFSYHPAYTEALKDGLRKAGVPEGPGEPDRFAEFKDLMTRDDNGLYNVEGARKIDAPQAKALYDVGDVAFVDVRAAGMFASGHVPGAVNLDLNMGFSEEHLSQVAGKNDAIVISCVGTYCPLSAWACAKALTWGFTRVYYFPGAVPAWKAAGYPIETSAVAD